MRLARTRLRRPPRAPALPVCAAVGASVERVTSARVAARAGDPRHRVLLGHRPGDGARGGRPRAPGVRLRAQPQTTSPSSSGGRPDGPRLDVTDAALDPRRGRGGRSPAPAASTRSSTTPATRSTARSRRSRSRSGAPSSTSTSSARSSRTQAALPAMRQAGRRHASSWSPRSAASSAIPFAAPYCASKHALEAMSDALRVELSRLRDPGRRRRAGPDRDALRRARALPSRAAALAPGPLPRALRRAPSARWTATSSGASAPPRVVARVILDAIESRRPRPRYPVRAWRGPCIPLSRVAALAVDRRPADAPRIPPPADRRAGPARPRLSHLHHGAFMRLNHPLRRGPCTRRPPRRDTGMSPRFPSTGQLWSIVLAGGEGNAAAPARRADPRRRPAQAVRGARRVALAAAPDARPRRAASPPERTVVVTTRPTRRSSPRSSPDRRDGRQSPRPAAGPRHGRRHPAAGPLDRAAGSRGAGSPCSPRTTSWRDDEAFMRHVAALAVVVGAIRAASVLVGAQPDAAETGYGWIEPGVELERTPAGGLRRVDRFVEKPSPEVAQRLHGAGRPLEHVRDGREGLRADRGRTPRPAGPRGAPRPHRPSSRLRARGPCHRTRPTRARPPPTSRDRCSAPSVGSPSRSSRRSPGATGARPSGSSRRFAAKASRRTGCGSSRRRPESGIVPGPMTDAAPRPTTPRTRRRTSSCARDRRCGCGRSGPRMPPRCRLLAAAVLRTACTSASSASTASTRSGRGSLPTSTTTTASDSSATAPAGSSRSRTTSATPPIPSGRRSPSPSKTPLQGQGVGTRLLERLAEIARARGIGTFEAEVLRAQPPHARRLRELRIRPMRRKRRRAANVSSRADADAATSRRTPPSAPSSAAAASMERLFEPPLGGRRRRQPRARKDRRRDPPQPRRHAAFAARSSRSIRAAAEIEGVRATRASPTSRARSTSPSSPCRPQPCRGGRRRLRRRRASRASSSSPPASARPAKRAGDARRPCSRRSAPPGCGWSAPTAWASSTPIPRVRLNATFAPVYPPEGRVALSSQSGALGLALLDYAARLNLGISTFVSVGQQGRRLGQRPRSSTGPRTRGPT